MILPVHANQDRNYKDAMKRSYQRPLRQHYRGNAYGCGGQLIVMRATTIRYPQDDASLPCQGAALLLVERYKKDRCCRCGRYYTIFFQNVPDGMVGTSIRPIAKYIILGTVECARAQSLVCIPHSRGKNYLQKAFVPHFLIFQRRSECNLCKLLICINYKKHIVVSAC